MHACMRVCACDLYGVTTDTSEKVVSHLRRGDDELKGPPLVLNYSTSS